MTLTVCVIIPTFNRAHYIDECLVSILGQTHKPDRIIVINDGSTDDTLEVLDKYSPLVEVYTKENGGRASAVNYGVKLATEDFIWIADDDDIADINGLKVLIDGIVASPAATLVYGDYRAFFDSDVHRKPQYPQRTKFQDDNHKIIFMGGMYTYQFAMLISRKAFLHYGGMREDMLRCADFEFTLRFTRFEKITKVNNVVFYQRWHDGDRGSLGHRFSSMEIERKGCVFDGIAFAEAVRSYNIMEFCPTFALGAAENEKLQASLVLRGLLSFKFSLWDQFINDISGAQQVSKIYLSDELSQVSENFLVSLLPLKILSENVEVILLIRKMYDSGGIGASVVFGLASPLMWNAKYYLFNFKIFEALELLYLAYKLLGLSGLARRIVTSYQK